MNTLSALLVGALGLAAFGAIMAGGGSSSVEPSGIVHEDGEAQKNSKTLVLGAGCFWCVEHIFFELKGVSAVESGYAGGAKSGVTYEEVSMGNTGHAEVIKITYDPGVISTGDLLRIFFTVHDPTTLNRQGGDVGPQYRSVIFYENDEQLKLAKDIKEEIVKEKLWKDPIVTTFEPLKNYTRAEEYHQDYFAKFEKADAMKRATMNAGYCTLVVEPKIRKFREKYASRLKSAG